MKLSDDRLRTSFDFMFNRNINGEESTIYPYNFVNNNKKNLVITIGDSWTWGADITNSLVDNDPQRLKQVFGALIANELSADFLNLGQSGACNLHIVQRIRELKTVIPELDYENITIICVYTEPCRSINGPYDKDINYMQWFKQNHFRQLIAYHNNLYQSELVELSNLHSNVRLLVGNNFTDPIGMDPRLELLPKNWLEVYNDKIIRSEYITPCYVMSHWIFDNLRPFIIEFCPGINRIELDLWLIELIEIAKNRKEFTMNPKYFGGISHPLAIGHRVWADYILEQL
jgi:hypothetical protein